MCGGFFFFTSSFLGKAWWRSVGVDTLDGTETRLGVWGAGASFLHSYVFVFFFFEGGGGKPEERG